MCLTVEEVDGVTGLPSAAPKMGPRAKIYWSHVAKNAIGALPQSIYTVYDEYER